MIKIRQTILARSIRQVNAINSPEYRPDLISKLRDRYSFLRVPMTADEMLGTDPLQGIKFQHGKFTHGDRPFVVELFQFLSTAAGNVIICDTHTSTDDSDLFLDDYIRQANIIRPDMIAVTESPTYASQLEFEMDKSLTDFCNAPIQDAAEAINSLLSRYKIKTPAFQPFTLAMMGDQVGIGGLPPSPFTIERRAGFRFGSNTFFSQAPLKTSDHVAVLERLAGSRI